ncbi:hypothetical protein P4M53_001430 [Escherichia coli]|uniref:hypothetical protein n=1 Tax=Escherichia coli TaxID=562 RepID=UPI000BE8E131|nr:hypothetical protein [Escherichia coli]EEV1957995.1 hypothetical protein [Escherichia coli]EFC5145463.1 hypothetical protein [Escherichia coli]EFC5148999.1 hypothetical protein [Escherichia coli]EFN4581510.1 hypothetical protein [Escherichia coli]EGF5362095.1 hypothetical protein [Escherichia coli]
MITVQRVDLTAKCWVVRPGARYRHFSYFIENNVIATGHLDSLSPEQIDFVTEITRENISHRINGFDEIGSRNVHTQIESFIADMHVGDVVFTLSGDVVVPGVITSLPYYEREKISNELDGDEFHIRRNVTWGESIRKRDVPLALQKSFNAYQAVFSLGEKSEEVLHWLMSFFITDKTFCTSLRIEQHDAIKHHTLKQLSELVDRIQVIALLIGEGFDGEISNELVQSKMDSFYETGKLSLTAQQMLMSPGDLWLQFKTNNRKSGIAFLIIMGAVLNQNVAFASVEDDQIREEISSLIAGKAEVAMSGLNFERVSRNLELHVKRQNRAFVNANPTNRSPDSVIDFPEDGDARHSGE